MRHKGMPIVICVRLKPWARRSRLEQGGGVADAGSPRVCQESGGLTSEFQVSWSG